MVVALVYVTREAVHEADRAAFASEYRAHLFHGRQFRDAVTPSHVMFTGNRTLVVGDSMVNRWYWPADKISLWGYPTQFIREEFELGIGQRTYDLIVLWPGTAHFNGGDSVEEYCADVSAMIDRAVAQSRSVVLIAPLPKAGVQEAAKGVAVIRERYPDLRVIDLTAWRDAAVASGRWDAWSEDELHMNAEGLAQLAAALAQAGLVAPGIPAAGEVAAAPAVATSTS